jgi:hypothetical protein
MKFRRDALPNNNEKNFEQNYFPHDLQNLKINKIDTNNNESYIVR